jgi:hypothetical protein
MYSRPADRILRGMVGCFREKLFSEGAAMSGRGDRDLGKERFWRKMLGRWQRSGGSVRGFCAEQGLSEPAFYSWRRTLAARDQEAASRQPRPRRPRGRGASAFVPVRVLPAAALEVVFPDGRVVRVPAGFDAATLRQLLGVLDEASPC